MANLVIENSELLFLRTSILEKYCRDVNENKETFINNLTGTLKYYEDIADVITEYINKEDKVISYAKFLNESPFKIILRKWLSENERLRHQKSALSEPAVSANILRKLIFYGPSNDKLSFKDYFILACYIYISADRTLILKKLVSKKPINKKTLNPREIASRLSDSNSTIPPFEEKIKCALIPLDEKNTGKKIAFHFSGNKIVLNRANLDPDNFTITSKIQATLNVVNGSWQIANESELKTTYIQIIKPFKLQKGDIIIFGNKHFIFEE